MSVRVTVPASTANLGPGFDCIGLALALHHTLIVSELPGSGAEISLAGEGSESLPLDETNPILVAMSAVFEKTGYRPGLLRVESDNRIPLARGLGSSAAATLAGLAAAAALAKGEVDREQLLTQASAREGHADNVCASLFGGFCVTAHAAGVADFVQLPGPPGLEAAVVIPDFELETIQSRAALPLTVSFDDAVSQPGTGRPSHSRGRHRGNRAVCPCDGRPAASTVPSRARSRNAGSVRRRREGGKHRRGDERFGSLNARPRTDRRRGFRKGDAGSLAKLRY